MVDNDLRRALENGNIISVGSIKDSKIKNSGSQIDTHLEYDTNIIKLDVERNILNLNGLIGFNYQIPIEPESYILIKKLLYLIYESPKMPDFLKNARMEIQSLLNQLDNGKITQFSEKITQLLSLVPADKKAREVVGGEEIMAILYYYVSTLLETTQKSYKKKDKEIISFLKKDPHKRIAQINDWKNKTIGEEEGEGDKSVFFIQSLVLNSLYSILINVYPYISKTMDIKKIKELWDYIENEELNNLKKSIKQLIPSKIEDLSFIITSILKLLLIIIPRE